MLPRLCRHAGAVAIGTSLGAAVVSFGKVWKQAFRPPSRCSRSDLCQLRFMCPYGQGNAATNQLAVVCTFARTHLPAPATRSANTSTCSTTGNGALPWVPVCLRSHVFGTCIWLPHPDAFSNDRNHFWAGPRLAKVVHVARASDAWSRASSGCSHVHR